MYGNLPRAIRFLRLQRGWTQAILAAKAGVSREFVSRLERDRASGATLGKTDRVVRALDGYLRTTVSWRGEQLDRLMDAGHAALQDGVAHLLRARGWTVRVEVSFSLYGDRGRVDILAFHPGLGIVLVVEVKTALGDLQETLGRLDVKVRVAQHLAREQGWADVQAVVPALVIDDARAARRIVARHPALFARIDCRGRRALAWLRRPGIPAPAGILWFAKGADSHPATIARRRRAPKGHVVRPA